MSMYHDHAPFWIFATNIIDGSNDIFGPFPGPAQLTYEHIRQGDDNGTEIFTFIDPQIDSKGDDADLTGYDSWIGDDERRYDGWRRLERIEAKESGFVRPTGPFYTDLVIHTEPPEEI